MPLSAGKNTNYTGPKTHSAIIKQVHREAKTKKLFMSRHTIERVVGLFFGPTGMGLNFTKALNFYIKGLGLFIIPQKYKSQLNIQVMHKRRRRRAYRNEWYKAKRRKEKLEKSL